MKLEKRSSFGWRATTASSAPCRNGLVVHYNDKTPMRFASKPHSACREYWRDTRAFHVRSRSSGGRGWQDIGYSYAVCVHGIVMEGRGWQREQAAQPGGNRTWTSVTFMSGEGERPTTAQVNAFRELRAWLRGKGLAAAIKGHRDFVSTTCPGSTLYSMVKSGELTGAPRKEEDDMKPTDSVEVGDYFKGSFSGEHYPAGFLWVGSLAEAKRARQSAERVEAMLAAQAATIDKLVDALAASQPDLEALKAEIREAIENIDVRLDVAEPEEETATP